MVVAPVAQRMAGSGTAAAVCRPKYQGGNTHCVRGGGTAGAVAHHCLRLGETRNAYWIAVDQAPSQHSPGANPGFGPRGSRSCGRGQFDPVSPELAWIFLTQEWPFEDTVVQPLETLKAGCTEEVPGAVGITFT